MLLVRNLAVVMSLAALAACSSNKCGTDLCAEPKCCDVKVEDLACEFAKNVGDRVYFAYDRDALSTEARNILVKQACWMKTNKCVKVLVEGHCDERGTVEYNMGLGLRRAQAVKDFLVTEGVEAERIRVISYGKNKPVNSNACCEKERLQANRVAISVIE